MQERERKRKERWQNKDSKKKEIVKNETEKYKIKRQ